MNDKYDELDPKKKEKQKKQFEKQLDKEFEERRKARAKELVKEQAGRQLTKKTISKFLLLSLGAVVALAIYFKLQSDAEIIKQKSAVSNSKDSSYKSQQLKHFENLVGFKEFQDQKQKLFLEREQKTAELLLSKKQEFKNYAETATQEQQAGASAPYVKKNLPKNKSGGLEANSQSPALRQQMPDQQVEALIAEKRNQAEMDKQERAEIIQRFKNAARLEGIEVEVDPATMDVISTKQIDAKKQQAPAEDLNSDTPNDNL
jgi:hypothetical protein